MLKSGSYTQKLLLFLPAVPSIPSGRRCWHWYPGRLSSVWHGWGDVLWQTGGRERESEREIGRESTSATLLASSPVRSAPAAPTFPHFLPTLSLSPLPPLWCWLSFSRTTEPEEILGRAGVTDYLFCMVWISWGFCASGKEEGRLSIPGGIGFYSKQAQCHPSFLFYPWQEHC